MRAVIGSALIQRLQPAAKPYEVRDTRLKGFLLRVQPSGVMSYYVEFARGQRCNLGRADAVAPAQAREQARAALATAYQGGDPRAAKREARAHTLRSYLEEVYAPWAEASIRSAKPTLARLRANYADLLDKRLAEVTPWLVEKWRAGRLKAGIKPSTVNRALDDLRAAYARAAEWGLLDGGDPLVGVRRSKVDSGAAVRYLTDEEEKRLLAALNARERRLRDGRTRANAWRAERGYALLPDLRGAAFGDHLKPLVVLSLHTGLRRGELFSLSWADVDLERAVLTVRGEKAKSGRTRHVPLNSEALSVLRGWRARATTPEGLVFPGRDGGHLDNVRKAWEGVLRAARVDRFRWHDLRHTFASRLVMAGVDLNTVRELLGHSDYKMTLRYSHLAPEHKAAAVARLAVAGREAMPLRPAAG